ncbi:hypothetical protein [Enterovibrio calviensis]|uniref:hypothetical protein n=1 Tax=Enterovibrio calviensis TaxID=91359 RepID=UPI003735B347
MQTNTGHNQLGMPSENRFIAWGFCLLLLSMSLSSFRSLRTIKPHQMGASGEDKWQCGEQWWRKSGKALNLARVVV